MMPKDPGPASGERHGIRNDALLLPASFRYDWQHSSSQLPINFSDARWISSPSGRYYLRKRMAGRAKAARSPDKPAFSPNTWATPSRTARNTCALRIGAIPIALYRARLRRPIWFSSVGRQSPPPNVPDRIGGPPSSSQAANRYHQRPPDLLPRRALFFCVATKQCCITALTFMAERPEFGLNFVKISA